MVESIRMKVDLDTEDLKRQLQKAFTGFNVGAGAGSMASGGGGGKSLASELGRTATEVAVGVGLLKGIESGINRIVKSSPALQASMKLIDTSLDVLLRPIAEVINFFIRPLAIAMLRFAIPFYIGFKKNIQELPGKIGAAIGGLLGLGAGSVAGGVAGAKVGGAIGTALGPGVGTAAGAAVGFGAGAILAPILGALGAGLGAAIGKFVGDLGKGLEGVITWFQSIDWEKAFEDFTTAVSDAINTAVTFITVDLPQAFSDFANDAAFNIGFIAGAFVKWATEDAPQAIAQFAEGVWTFFTETLPTAFFEGWNALQTFLTVTLPDAIQTGWEAAKTFLTVTLPKAITDAFDAVKTFFTETVPEWANTAVSAINNVIGGIGRFIDDLKSSFFAGFEAGRGGEEGAQIGGTVKRTGLALVHAGERVVRYGETGGSGGNTINQNINISLDIKDESIDLERLARRLRELFRTEMSATTMYG